MQSTATSSNSTTTTTATASHSDAGAGDAASAGESTRSLLEVVDNAALDIGDARNSSADSWERGFMSLFRARVDALYAGTEKDAQAKQSVERLVVALLALSAAADGAAGVTGEADEGGIDADADSSST